MAGKKENLGPMWEELRKYMTLDPPVKMVENQYLGSTQREMTPEPVNIEKMSAAFENFSIKAGEQSGTRCPPGLTT